MTDQNQTKKPGGHLNPPQNTPRINLHGSFEEMNARLNKWFADQFAGFTFYRNGDSQ